jgi:pimeloyl-ACP methyl ester carboxylesterase
VKGTGWIGVLLLLGLPLSSAQANWLDKRELERVNRRLHGQVIDHTHNHGADRRIWSPALCQRRDLYVYLPPGFDPCQLYPVVVWLHGFAQDEHSFLNDVIEPLDRAIACGKLPRVIIAAPDGSLNGRACLFSAGSFFLNTKAGAFEDYLMQDVWGFLVEHYPIRPEPEAHVLAGASMGGGAAFNLGIKYRDRFKVVVGFFPPLNNRWVDCHGRYMRPFDPDCWGWRTDLSRGHEVVGRFYGVVTIRVRQVVDPLYDRRAPQVIQELSRENPIEMLDSYGLRDGELAMFVAYSGRDQFNIGAQVESFLYVARQRGLHVDVAYDPEGKHDTATALKLYPCLLEWLAPRLAPYSPPPVQ